MTSPLRSILIGTSLSAESDPVVRTGVTLARASGAAIHLVHAYRSPAPPYGGLLAEVASPESPWIEDDRQSLFTRLELQALRTGLGEISPKRGLVREGVPEQVLLEMAEQTHADLIVIGTAETGGRRALGSIAGRVIAKAPCPVLAVCPGAVYPPSRVLVPVDLSPLSARALRRGLGLLAAAGADGASTEALFVLNPLESEGSLQFTPAQIGRFAAGELEHFVTAALRHLDGVSYRVRTGYPAEEILAEQESWQADLVLLGTHGRSSGLERILIGSVAADVLREVHCSLLVVPPGAGLNEEDEAAELARIGADWSYVPDAVAAI
jgi:universal stress protein E